MKEDRAGKGIQLQGSCVSGDGEWGAQLQRRWVVTSRRQRRAPAQRRCSGRGVGGSQLDESTVGGPSPRGDRLRVPSARGSPPPPARGPSPSKKRCSASVSSTTSMSGLPRVHSTPAPLQPGPGARHRRRGPRDSPGSAPAAVPPGPPQRSPPARHWPGPCPPHAPRPPTARSAPCRPAPFPRRSPAAGRTRGAPAGGARRGVLTSLGVEGRPSLYAGRAGPPQSSAALWAGEDSGLPNLRFSEPNLRGIPRFLSFIHPPLSNNNNNLHFSNICYVPGPQ